MELEVLPAQQGDCLILHSETDDGPGLILIDGGPAGVSRATLFPRLQELRDERGLDDDEPLVIDLVIVSHVDDDHIKGVIDLFDGMLDLHRANEPPRFVVKGLWHNTFDRVLGNDETGGLRSTTQFGGASMTAVIEEADEGAPTDHAKVLASIPQGDELRNLAKALDIPVNAEFGGALIQTAAPGPGATRPASPEVAGVKLTVVGPLQPELIQLQKAFDTWLRTQPPSERTEQSLLASLDDESAANLSSIVLLAEADGRTILLTGDARSDKMMEGLEECGLLPEGRTLQVDILKMPHHGSIRNLDDEGDFVGRVTSGKYVFSGNGEHGNPDRETVELLLKVRPGAEMTFYFTYPLAEMDPVRQETHDHERERRIRKGKPGGPEWNDATHALIAVLSPPPKGVTVISNDGSVMEI
ncbi:MAG TPA: hypothetical protein VM942_09535 [Acidimicrobiales bacterium]|nr:hypothetical protein [Acidimicrobiales bacterium]